MHRLERALKQIAPPPIFFVEVFRVRIEDALQVARHALFSQPLHREVKVIVHETEIDERYRAIRRDTRDRFFCLIEASSAKKVRNTGADGMEGDARRLMIENEKEKTNAVSVVVKDKSLVVAAIENVVVLKGGEGAHVHTLTIAFSSTSHVGEKWG